jgi:hypothetical protein
MILAFSAKFSCMIIAEIPGKTIPKLMVMNQMDTACADNNYLSASQQPQTNLLQGSMVQSAWGCLNRWSFAILKF